MSNDTNNDINLDKYVAIYRDLARAWFTSGGRGVNWKDRKQVYDQIYDEQGNHAAANAVPASKRAFDAVDRELCDGQEPEDWRIIAREAREREGG